MKRMAAIAVLLAGIVGLSACTKAVTTSKAVTDPEPASGHHHHEHQAASGDVQAMWQMNPEQPQAKAATRIRFMAHGADGEPITKFAVLHEKLLHLIVVSKDLSYFNHIHPDFDGEGIFTVSTKFPFGGEYRLFAEYQPEGSGTVVSKQTIELGGEKEQKPLTVDKALTKSTGHEIVTLSHGRLAAGEETTLAFHISDAATKTPVRDLEPYLGAAGHVVIISGDAEQYIHVHPDNADAAGPEAVFHAVFPKAGVYKVWGQFAREGRPITVSYTLQVK
ncbi:hypothetical protein [Paenibacillus montanisoli]|uniref:YtkA-like domain-containing protein n=1 Tax=Paenibacillus montanisoli TaxID=2081970 RepID=A0A328TXN2_9BACL|nr:hypothetical protein [Paenibacillus montanisoli]RAP74452.1 hypothetical protein DL346_20485 [Paenibacillus montanisoli]